MTTPGRCVRCALTSGFPGLTFDDEGVCSFCRDEILVVSEQSAIDAAREQIRSLFKTRAGPYDAVLCNSGGKDSCYTLKLAVEKYGLRVLSFTLDQGFMSPTAVENIHVVVDALGVDHITVRPSAKFFRKVMRTTALLPIYQEQVMRRISAGCNGCISMVNTTALRIALEKGVNVILAGFTLGQIPANGIVYRNHFRFLQAARKDSLDKLRDAIGPEVDDYYGIDAALLDRVKEYPFNVNLLCLETVTEDQIRAEVGKLGWRSPTDVDGCSSNCRVNTLNNFIHQKRYGFNPYELELSHLVRKQLMTREEAISKIEDQPRGELRSMARQLGFSEQDCQELGIPE